MNIKILAGVVALAAAPAFAQDVQLACSQGTKQIGGAKSFMEAVGCVKFGADGSRIFHGPYIAYWKSGVKQAEGQYEQGRRAGKWVFFDEQGLKTGETEFKAGDYDGLRVEFWPNGQKKLEETYVMGVRQGAPRLFDQAGRVLGGAEAAPKTAATTR
jgi:hypothetical protein